MKVRPFLSLLLAFSLLAFGLGIAGWWQVWREGPFQLAHQPLAVPRAARFVPRQAPMSLFLFSDGEQPLDYVRAVAPPRQRRQAVDTLAALRDGAFAAAGLDYSNELAEWMGPDIGLALFDGGPEEPTGAAVRRPPSGWLLCLSSRDEAGARRFLQRFWQLRSLAGADLQVTTYRGMGLISGRGALLGRPPVPLATALIDDHLVLIASGRGVLEEALDVSQIDELNLADQLRSGARLENLGDGAALLVLREEGMERWMGLPRQDGTSGRPSSLMLAIRPQGRTLRLEGILEPLTLPVRRPGQGAALPDAGPWDALSTVRGDPSTLALLRNPAAWLEVPLLRPLLGQVALLGPGAGPIPALVAAADAGPLLVADGPEGWLLGTASIEPDPAELEAALAAEGWIPAPLERGDRSLLTWVRLAPSARGRQGHGTPEDGLVASLAGWRDVEDRTAWWGRRLELLESGSGVAAARQRQRQLMALDRPEAPIQWALAAGPSRDLLARWQPWKLLNAMAGGGLGNAPRVLALALDVDPDSDSEALRLRGRLELGVGRER